MAYVFGSIWDRPNRNALNALSKSVEQQGKSIQDLVAKGQLTPTQYATLIQTVNGLISKGNVSPLDINRNLGKFDSTYFTNDFLEELNKGAIQATKLLPSSVLREHVDNGAITGAKTTFLKPASSNLFNKNNVVYGYSLNAEGEPVASDTFGYTELINVENSSKYLLGGLHGYVRVNFLDANRNFGESYTTTASVNTPWVITIPADSSYMIVNVRLSQVNDFYINKGENDLGYEDYYDELTGVKVTGNDIKVNSLSGESLKDGSITSSKLSKKAVNIEKISDSVNSLLQARVIPNNELNFKLGSITVSGSDAESTIRIRSDFFNVTGKTVISNKKNEDIKISVYLYNENNGFISNVPFTFSDLSFEHNGKVKIIAAYRNDREITDIKKLADLVDVYTTGKSIKNEHLADGIIDGTKIKEKSISKSNIGFISNGTNLFDREALLDDTAILSTDGTLVYNAKYLSTGYINVKAEEYYTTRQFNRVAFYDKDKNYISMLDFPLPPSEFDTFKTPANTEYIRLHINKVYYNPLETRLNKGAELLPFEDYQIYIDGYPIIKDSTDETEGAVIYPPEEIGKNALLQNKEFQYPTVPELYQMYDELIAEFPKILSKKIYGKDTTGEFDIWELHLKPEEYDKSIVGQGARGTLAGKKPKITFIAGIHGHEQSSVVGTYYFIEALLKQWKNDDVLDYLRHNVEFKFIPLVYPNGYITDMYSNVTGINLQTNFPYNFTPRDPESNVYGGEEPLTELEVQYVKNLIDENTDSVLFVDLHSPGYSADFAPGVDSLFYYLIARDKQYTEDMDIITKHSVESITRFLKKNYPIDNDNLLGWVTYRDGNGTADAYGRSVGIPSMVLEVPSRTPYNLTKLNSDSIKMSAEVIANSFAISLKHFKDNQ